MAYDEGEYKRRTYMTSIRRTRGVQLTLLIIAINFAIYLYTAFLSKDLSIDVDVLIKLGGNTKHLVEEGELYRLFNSMFLHGDFSHIAFNMYAIFLYGSLLEPMIGKWKYLLLYLVSGLAGSLLSHRMHDYYTVSIGASGAVFGLLGALIGYALFEKGLFRKGALPQLVFVALLNLLWGFQPNSGIDNFAHLGGLLAGILISLILKPARRK